MKRRTLDTLQAFPGILRAFAEGRVVCEGRKVRILPATSPGSADG